MHMKNSARFCSLQEKRIKSLFGYGLLFLILSFVLGVLLGSTPLAFSEIVDAFRGQGTHTAGGKIFWYVRLPRTLSALACGAALSVSGAVIQGVLANRLASPSIIGVNAGAGLSVTLCTALGLYGGLLLSAFAFAGAFAAVMLVSLGAKKWGASRGTVILLGVALNSLFGALSDMVVTIVPEVAVMRSDFRIGEFSAVPYATLVPAAALILLAILVLFTLTSELDVLTLGEDNAKALGMHTERMRTLFLLLSALLAGSAVSLAGLISFVGLIVPHAVRRIAGNKSAHLLGLCALYGSAFVCLCDTVARTLFAPYEIPVGIIMAFLGAPFFVFILIRGKGGHRRVED